MLQTGRLVGDVGYRKYILHEADIRKCMGIADEVIEMRDSNTEDNP